LPLGPHFFPGAVFSDFLNLNPFRLDSSWSRPSLFSSFGAEIPPCPSSHLIDRKFDAGQPFKSFSHFGCPHPPAAFRSESARSLSLNSQGNDGLRGSYVFQSPGPSPFFCKRFAVRAECSLFLVSKDMGIPFFPPFQKFDIFSSYFIFPSPLYPFSLKRRPLKLLP